MLAAEGSFSSDIKEEVDAWKYRPITGLGRGELYGANIRDLASHIQERQHSIAYSLWLKNPIAKRVVELMRVFTIGPYWKANNEKAQTVLERHWHDPFNNWDIEQYSKTMELSLFGEQIYPAFINEHTGNVRLGYIDPYCISKIETKPSNSMVIDKIHYRGRLGSTDGNFLYPVLYDEDGEYGQILAEEGQKRNTVGKIYKGKNTKGRLIGECFYFAVNKVSAASRGHTDLLAIADWLDAYDEALFTELDRLHFLRNYIWDVTVEDADEAQLKEFVRLYANPRPGAIRVHNQRIKWDAVTPDIKGNDLSASVRLLKMHILSGAGFPEHWFAEGSSTTRATAAEMGLPTLKTLESRRGYFGYMLDFIGRFQIDQALIFTDELDGTKPPYFQTVVPGMTEKQISEIATALNQLTQALMVAESQHYIETKEAARLFQTIAKELGYEIKVPEV